MSDIPSILDTAKYRHLIVDKLESVAGFNLPPYDEVDLSNYVAADKPQTIIFKHSGANVTTLTLSYDGSNNLTSIVRS
jgi:hypothetical protein